MQTLAACGHGWLPGWWPQVVVGPWTACGCSQGWTPPYTIHSPSQVPSADLMCTAAASEDSSCGTRNCAQEAALAITPATPALTSAAPTLAWPVAQYHPQLWLAQQQHAQLVQQSCFQQWGMVLPGQQAAALDHCGPVPPAFQHGQARQQSPHSDSDEATSSRSVAPASSGATGSESSTQCTWHEPSMHLKHRMRVARQLAVLLRRVAQVRKRRQQGSNATSAKTPAIQAPSPAGCDLSLRGKGGNGMSADVSPLWRIVQRVEVSLYLAAPSLHAYRDIHTLVPRLAALGHALTKAGLKLRV